MRIGIDARALFSKQAKGISVSLANLLNAIKKQDIANNYLLYYDKRKELASPESGNDRFLYKGLQIRFGDTYHFWESLRLPLAILSDEIDIFHSPANGTCFSPCPNVVTIHDTILQEIRHNRAFDRLYYYIFQPLLARRASHVITDSFFSAERLKKVFRISESKISVIPLGIDEEIHKIDDPVFLESVRLKYRLITPYILIVGGESPWKNIEKAIEAYAVLKKEQGIEENLVVVGIRTDEIVHSHLKRISELGLQDNITLLGYVPKMDLVGLYNCAKIFLYPSLFEGFGFPPLEAMACGVPVVASNAASIPENVGDAALLFDGRKTREMVSAIRTVLWDSDLRNTLRCKGSEHTKNFKWKNTAEKTLEVYRRVYYGSSRRNQRHHSNV